jgi:hypothetical protein
VRGRRWRYGHPANQLFKKSNTSATLREPEPLKSFGQHALMCPERTRGAHTLASPRYAPGQSAAVVVAQATPCQHAPTAAQGFGVHTPPTDQDAAHTPCTTKVHAPSDVQQTPHGWGTHDPPRAHGALQAA